MQPRMSRQTLSILATMLVSFSVAVMVLLWERKLSQAPAPPAAVARAILEPAPAVAPPPPQSLSSEVPRSAQPSLMQASVQSEVDSSTKAPVAEDYSSGPELPLLVGIVRKSVYTIDEDADGVASNVTKQVNEGNVANLSDKPLTVTVIEVNIPTQETSRTQFVLAPGTQKHFGEDLGLKMLSGDQLTLRSPSYRELTRQIP